MNFLVIGCGSIGKRHISNLKHLGVTSIYCLRRDSDTNFEEQYGVVVIRNIGELGDTKIDAVIVCTPTSLHVQGLEIARQLSAAVLMEKPLIDTEGGLQMATASWMKTDKTFLIGFMLRYHPLVAQLKNLIDTKVLGTAYSARFEFGSYLPYWHPWEDYHASYASKRSLGGGVIRTITHELDLVQYFFGSPISVYANAMNFGKLGIEVEELSECILEYNDKVVTIHLDYLQKDYGRNITVLCDEGKLVWDWHSAKIRILKHKDQAKEIGMTPNFDINDLYVSELRDFIHLVESKTTRHSLDFDHARENTKIMLLMVQSAQLGRKILC